MIFEGPCSPKFMADALVASEKVGDGGEAGAMVELCLGVTVDVLIARERRERALGIVHHSDLEVSAIGEDANTSLRSQIHGPVFPRALYLPQTVMAPRHNTFYYIRQLHHVLAYGARLSPVYLSSQFRDPVAWCLLRRFGIRATQKSQEAHVNDHAAYRQSGINYIFSN